MPKFIPIKTNGMYDYGAEFSGDGKHRFTLWRFWREPRSLVAFIGLNPSTADATQNDPTIHRCQKFAEQWGFDGFYMLNLYSLRSTDPKGLKCEDFTRTENIEAVMRICRRREVREIVLAWGVDGCDGEHLAETLRLSPQVEHPRCLGKTKDGYPRHPLYLRKDAELEVC